jgi:cysteine-rich repeat protein
VQHQPAGSFWLVVDGVDGQSGEYTVDISCSAPTCGDLVVNEGEECDLGQGVGNDTCSDTCTAEGAIAADSCLDVGAPFQVSLGTTVLPASDPWFTNADANHDAIGSCAYQGELDGKDEVFAFVPEASGTLTIATALDLAGNAVCTTFLEPECWFSFLFVREADCTNGAELACSGIDLDTGANQISLPVTAGTTYYLFVDGLNGEFYSYGPYTLHFTLVP